MRDNNIHFYQETKYFKAITFELRHSSFSAILSEMSRNLIIFKRYIGFCKRNGCILNFTKLTNIYMYCIVLDLITVGRKCVWSISITV